jgi:hypothetical protein
MRRVRITFSFSLLSMIIGLVFLKQGVDHIWSGGTFRDRAYAWLQAIGLLLLVVSSLTIAAGAIYGSRKQPSASSAATGAVCLGIAIAFWWVGSIEGINTHDWTLALVVPQFIWTAAGVVLLLVSAVRITLGRIRS